MRREKEKASSSNKDLKRRHNNNEFKIVNNLNINKTKLLTKFELLLNPSILGLLLDIPTTARNTNCNRYSEIKCRVFFPNIKFFHSKLLSVFRETNCK